MTFLIIQSFKKCQIFTGHISYSRKLYQKNRWLYEAPKIKLHLPFTSTPKKLEFYNMYNMNFSSKCSTSNLSIFQFESNDFYFKLNDFYFKLNDFYLDLKWLLQTTDRPSDLLILPTLRKVHAAARPYCPELQQWPPAALAHFSHKKCKRHYAKCKSHAKM